MPDARTLADRLFVALDTTDAPDPVGAARRGAAERANSVLTEP